MRVKSESRRQAILDIAADVFSEHGFENASMSEISARVGGSKKTLYSYFASKEELFLEVTLQYAVLHMQGTSEELDPEKDLPATLQTFGECLLGLLCSPRMIAVLRMVYSAAGRLDASRQFYERGPLQGEEILERYFAACQARGKLRPNDPKILSRYFMAMLQAETREPLHMGACTTEDLPPLPEIVARAVSAFLDAFAA